MENMTVDEGLTASLAPEDGFDGSTMMELEVSR
jgi:hypothetical protein